MCQMCDTLDSMVECLESLYDIKKMREVMIELATTESIANTIREMCDHEIKTNFAIDLLVHWADSNGADPLQVISKIAIRWSGRIEAHAEKE